MMLNGIIGLLLLLCMVVYMIGGTAGGDFWSSYAFTLDDLFMILILFSPSINSLTISRNKGLLSHVLVVLLAVVLFKLVCDVFSFFYPEVWRSINTSYEIGGIVAIYMLIMFIVYRYGRVVKK